MKLAQLAEGEDGLRLNPQTAVTALGDPVLAR